MLPVRKALALHSHPLMTYALKIGCRDTYRMIRESVHGDLRKLEVISPSEMSHPLLTASVNFLSFEQFSYDDVFADYIKKSGQQKRFFHTRISSEQISQAHTDTLMDLRRHIVGDAHIPWDEKHVHFWSDFETLYRHMDIADRLEVDGFFKLLCGNTYETMAAEHHIVTRQPISMVDEHPYEACKNLDTLVRGDVARHQFSVIVGSEAPIKREESENDDSGSAFSSWMECPYDSLGWDDGPTEREYLKRPYTYPELGDFEFSNPGTPYSELDEAIHLTFERQISEGHMRNIKFLFRGETILTGELTCGAFKPVDIKPVSKQGVRMSRQLITDTLNKSQQSTGVEVQFERMFAADLGL